MNCLVFGNIFLQTDAISLCWLDTSCNVTLVNWVWLLKKAAAEKIWKMANLLKVRGIRSSKHESDKFISMFLDFSDINSRNRPIYLQIYWKLHLVEGLKANLLVSNNILATEELIINIANKTAIISRCQIIIFL